jgi:23S rRNA (cytosine1962-C5)-methyltransferase
VRSGHPWVFSKSVREQNREGEAGELAVIYDRADRFLAVGLFDPESVLRIRVLHVGKPVQIDETWWKARLESAVAKRAGILDGRTTACRLINGESDGWPGLVLDQYEGVLVLKLYTAAWRGRIDLLTRLLCETFRPQSVVLRLSRNVQSFFQSQGFNDGKTIFGAPVNGPIVFRETGIVFEADVVSGQKTGFFLDQRENRREVEKLSLSRDVLNAFSFSGGFSLYAARGGANSVSDLDISPHALTSARRNFDLNRNDSSIVRCRHETVQTNAFEWLEGNVERRFDLVVLDPPSLAKRETERAGAIRAYEKLAANALAHLRKKGALVAASCSAHVSAEEFFGAVTRAATQSGRKFSVLNKTRHAPDHPATFAEAEYLKCIYLRFAT